MNNILLLGSGAREHALAWKLAQSADIEHIFVAPGNGGTAHEAKCSNVALASADFPQLIDFARDNSVDFIVVGPEDPLAAGAVDAFQEAGIPAFGPGKAAAQLEGSKAFARDFMVKYDIPTPRYRNFTDFNDAVSFLYAVDFDVVVKASGLAAGKGVIVPETKAEAEDALRAIMVERAFGGAGDVVVIEEKMVGQEVSILAFSDGERLAVMPQAQDHKPVFEGDKGPNTGGMGVYVPAPLLDIDQLAEVERSILRPTIEGMAAEGAHYRGVLYAGLMLTTDGPKVLEFNCRFGDPETEVILPLLDGDLLPILRACADGALDPDKVRWADQSAACVIAASPGYPGSYPKGLPITGVDEAAALPDVTIFHAGTKVEADERLVTAGGRVLAVTTTGSDMDEALVKAYEAIGHIHFEGMHYRRDIGARVR